MKSPLHDHLLEIWQRKPTHSLIKTFIVQELLDQVCEKKTVLDKLASRYNRLAQDSSESLQHDLLPLQESWQKIITDLNEHIAKRRSHLEKCEAYHHKHKDINAELGEIGQEVDRVHRREDTPVAERRHQLEVNVWLFRVHGVSFKYNRMIIMYLSLLDSAFVWYIALKSICNSTSNQLHIDLVFIIENLTATL